MEKKKKKWDYGNVFLGIFLILLLIPQTRTPITVAVNQLKMMVFSPSEMDANDQLQLDAFEYHVADLYGNSRSFGIGKGSPVFLGYWATWCGPCIAELPSIQELHADYGDQVQFVLLTQEAPEVVRAFLDKRGLDLPVFFPQMDTPKTLYESSIPTNYIIDGQGTVRVKETGAANWNSGKVRKLLDGMLGKPLSAW
ncbi:TlpA family protein disulfide reductase [Maribacter sp. 2307ULW6-5]|uniref:TlpA family protein disulfide reductase n=1 Tax=Maribacter sp. 2307ULW6-5 TaxID=3386275 RepID=UPI0039BC9A75